MGAIDVDRAAVSFDDVLDDAQSEAGTATGTASCLIDPIESLEKSGKVLFGNSDSGISHVESDEFALVF